MDARASRDLFVPHWPVSLAIHRLVAGRTPCSQGASPFTGDPVEPFAESVQPREWHIGECTSSPRRKSDRKRPTLRSETFTRGQSPPMPKDPSSRVGSGSPTDRPSPTGSAGRNPPNPTDRHAETRQPAARRLLDCVKARPRKAGPNPPDLTPLTLSRGGMFTSIHIPRNENSLKTTSFLCIRAPCAQNAAHIVHINIHIGGGRADSRGRN